MLAVGVGIGTPTCGEVLRWTPRALAILDEAGAAGDSRTALAAIREARGALQLFAQLTGALREHVGVHRPSEEPPYVAEWGKGTPTTTPVLRRPER